MLEHRSWRGPRRTEQIPSFVGADDVRRTQKRCSSLARDPDQRSHFGCGWRRGCNRDDACDLGLERLLAPSARMGRFEKWPCILLPVGDLDDIPADLAGECAELSSLSTSLGSRQPVLEAAQSTAHPRARNPRVAVLTIGAGGAGTAQIGKPCRPGRQFEWIRLRLSGCYRVWNREPSGGRRTAPSASPLTIHRSDKHHVCRRPPTGD